MFRNRKVFKRIICGIRNHDYTDKEIGILFQTVPAKVLRKLAKEIIYLDYDGYNGMQKDSTMYYFDSLDRWQKEFFIKERLYKLYT